MYIWDPNPPEKEFVQTSLINPQPGVVEQCDMVFDFYIEESKIQVHARGANPISGYYNDKTLRPLGLTNNTRPSYTNKNYLISGVWN